MPPAPAGAVTTATMAPLLRDAGDPLPGPALASAVLADGAGTNLALPVRQEVTRMSDTPRSILMPDSPREDQPGPIERRDEQVGENRRDQSFQEVPAPQGLKTPPLREVGEDSGEWTTGGGSDPNELDDTQPSPDDSSR